VAGEAAAGETAGQELCLVAPLARQRRVELALDAVVAVPRGLPMADEKQARGSRARW
jgi:hypothetical protein